MNKEIKFRAWDVEAKKMLFANDCFLRLNFYGEVLMRNGSEVTSHFEIMQYTGLKDKNDKEIYEGDIIHAIGYVNTGYIVEWKNYHGWCLRFPENKEAIWLNNQTWENAEVIGNIYENPDLLK